MRNLLLEITATDQRNNTTIVLRASTRNATPAGVYLDGKEWIPALIGGLNFKPSYWSEGKPKPLDVSYGALSVVLDASTGSHLWPRYETNGALATIWIGELGAPFASYRQLWSGQTGPIVRESDQTMRLPLLGAEAGLDRDLLSLTYAGTGGEAGEAGLRGKWKPYVAGACTNVAPILIDPAKWVYQVHAYGPCPITAVYENALTLGAPKATVATYAELIALTLGDGEWAAAPAVGMFRLKNEPAGKITADVGSAASPGGVARSLMLRAGIGSAKIDASVAAANDRAYDLYVTDQASILDLVRDAALAAGRYLIADSTGKFFLAPITSTKAPGVLTSKRSAYPLVIPDSITQEPTSLPAYKVRIGHTRVWAVHSYGEISPAVAEIAANQAALNAQAELLAEAAEQAQADASLALTRYDAMASDGVLDRPEKLRVIQEFAEFTAERAGLINEGNNQGATDPTNAYANAYTALKTYLEGLSPAYNDTTQDTPIDALYITRFNNYRLAKTALVNACANKAAKSANWTGVADRPVDLAGLDKDASDKLDGIEDGATVGAPVGTNIGDKPVADVLAALEKLRLDGLLDTAAPTMPTGLALSSVLTDAGVTLTATWNPVSASDLAGYEIAIGEGAIEPFTYTTTAPKWERAALARNTEYRAKVRAFDKAGNRSAYSAVVSHITVRDLVPPAAPTGIVANAAFETVWLKWTNAADTDLTTVEVWHATSNNSGAAVRLATVVVAPSTQGSFIHTGLTAASTNYYWLKSIDSSGNISGFSAGSGAVQTAYVDISDVAPDVNQGLTKTVSSLPNPVGYTGSTLVLLTTDNKLYRYVNGAWTAAVATTDLSGLVAPTQVDQRGLFIKDLSGGTVFGPDGYISPIASIDLNGNNVKLTTLASNALTPSLHFVGEFAQPPVQAALGDQWRQNAVYKNTLDGHSYVLTGEPLGWQIYLSDGNSFTVAIESTNGTVFRVGQAKDTQLNARLFKNGAEITAEAPAHWFRWRRVSGIPMPAPQDDATFNAQYAQGYKSISINIDNIHARATFFVDVIN